jgi:hypothetical protein
VAQFTSAGGGGVPLSGTVQISGATSPLISNIALTTAATEVGIALPANCKKFELKLRDTRVLKIAYVLGDSGTTYRTLWPGCVWTVEGIDAAGLTIYVQSPSASQIVELETWT